MPPGVQGAGGPADERAADADERAADADAPLELPEGLALNAARERFG
jgi:hypothetical protein